MATKVQPVEAVRGADLERYMGRWYEIASIPSRFQPKNGINTRATYTLKEDGTVGVLNETWTDGKRGSIEGKAWKVDPSSDEAKLIVQFRVPPFLPLFTVHGDYWILALDKEGYEYALVGQPTRKNLWVLSRKPEMADEVYNGLLDAATQQGYDVSRLKRTEHEGEGEPAVKNDGGGWWIKSLFQKT